MSNDEAIDLSDILTAALITACGEVALIIRGKTAEDVDEAALRRALTDVCKAAETLRGYSNRKTTWDRLLDAAKAVRVAPA